MRKQLTTPKTFKYQRFYNTLCIESQAKINRNFDFSFARSIVFAVIVSCMQFICTLPPAEIASFSCVMLTGVRSTFYWQAPPSMLSSKFSLNFFLQCFNHLFTSHWPISSVLLAVTTKVSRKASEVEIWFVLTVVVSNFRMWRGRPILFVSFVGSFQKHASKRWASFVLEWSQNARSIAAQLSR